MRTKLSIGRVLSIASLEETGFHRDPHLRWKGHLLRTKVHLYEPYEEGQPPTKDSAENNSLFKEGMFFIRGEKKALDGCSACKEGKDSGQQSPHCKLPVRFVFFVSSVCLFVNLRSRSGPPEGAISSAPVVCARKLSLHLAIRLLG